jgi:CO/xanthine dehydrogenase Mo-binding subunit
MNTIQVDRRKFLKGLGLTCGGLVMGISLPGCTANQPLPKVNEGLNANAFIQITSTGEIHFILPRDEMGQGVYTGLSTLVAEELDVPPESIIVHFAPVNSAYNNAEFSMQGTGGSTSMKASYYPIRQAAANTRALLLAAAIKHLKASPSDLTTKDGQIIYQGITFSYGQFVIMASTLELPSDAPLKQPPFKYIGHERTRNDALLKSTGTAQFGLDVEIDNLHHAVVVRSPVFGGSVAMSNADIIETMKDVHAVISLDHGIAVVAQHYWQAKKAAEQLKITWTQPELAQLSSSDIEKNHRRALLETGEEAHFQGDKEQAKSNSSQIVEAEYWAPYETHAPMESMNCVIKIQNSKCDVWTGNQGPQLTQAIAAYYADLNKEDVTVHQTFLGGGFGRRGLLDFVAETASIAKHLDVPVQLVWSREDDIQHGYYRPAAATTMKAGLNDKGEIQSWYAKRAGANIMPYLLDDVLDPMMPGFVPNAMADWLSKRGYGLFDGMVVDPTSVEGLWEDYDVPQKEVQHVTYDPKIRLGFWRSVGHSFTGFFKESFMDELAHAAAIDPIEYRLMHSKNNPRLNEVIRLAASKAGWPAPSKPGRYLGVAAHFSFNSYVAEIAEISIEHGKVRVHKVTCAVDCGLAVNPDIVRAQMEGGIIFGLTAALEGGITFNEGAVEQSNFHDYPMLRMAESPDIEVHIVDSQEDPTGVGEPGVPPIAPAVANAIFAATGTRLRRLPLTLS